MRALLANGKPIKRSQLRGLKRRAVITAEEDEMRRLLEAVLSRVSEAGMHKGEVKPQHSCSIRSEDERQAVKQLLALAGPRIEFTGFVPDLRPHLAEAAAVIVPLRLGGGTRLKNSGRMPSTISRPA